MASTQETSTSIIKSDRVGRTRYSQAYKDEVVAAYLQSGMSAAIARFPENYQKSFDYGE